ncbi:MAG: LamG domain-containing protein [Phycisphaerae bacterium]|nr:LamG domain-containing protein [Phycisphaerae bacterium]
MRFFTAASGIVEGDGVEDISALDNVSAHWKLNEVEGTTVADSSANTNNGTATVTISTLTATGKVGTGCFDLADAYTVEVSSHATLSFTDDADDEDFSIVCWAYVTAQKELQNILSKWRDDSTTREWRFSLSEDRKPQLHLADTSVDLSDNRIAQWLLNEDAANTTVLDEDATSHDGTASSNTNTISTTGQINTCFDFGGSESVNISDDDEFTFGDGSDDSVFSISAWIYVTGHTGNQTIVSKWDADDVKEWWFYLDASENLVLRLSDQSASAQIAQTSDDALTTGWHHVIATYDATEAETGIVLYVDGTGHQRRVRARLSMITSLWKISVRTLL